MDRKTDVVVNHGTWPGGKAPTDIAKIAGSRTVNVLSAMIQTAICTRPPEVFGFHLSDFWAFLRYGFAIADVADLRLRPEWDATGAHQKSVLSDELGMGFTTDLLAQTWGCRDFADTNYVVNVVAPESFSLKASKKNGPKKSPDFIATDSSGAYYVLECKGSQSSRKKLSKAMESGADQKRNLRAKAPTAIKHSLVAGLFIPQFKNAESSCIQLADPSWDELGSFLADRSRPEVDEGILQISLAKSLAVSGFALTPTTLSRLAVGTERRLSSDDRAEITQRRTARKSAEMELVYALDDLRPLLGASHPLARVRFWVDVPDGILARLAADHPIDELVRDLVASSRASEWQHATSEHRAEVRTPLGFKFRVEFD